MEAARNRKLGKSVVVVGITAAISQLLSVGYLVFLARWVGPETYAIHVGIFNLCMISVFLVNWGLDTWLLKVTSEDPASSTTVLQRVLSLKLSFGIVWALALIAIAPVLRPEIFLRNLLLLAVISTLAETLTNSIYTVLLTTDRFRQSSAILLVGRTIRLFSLIGLAFFSIKNLSLIIAIRTLIDLAVLIIAGAVFGLIFSEWSFKLAPLKKTFSDSVPFHASDLINIIFRQVDVTLVTFLSSSLVTISNYSLMISFFNVVSTIVLSLMNVIVPSLAREKDQPVEARRKALLRTMLGFLVLGLVGWAAIVLFGQKAVNLVLGSQYALASEMIIKAAVIVLISSINVGFVAIIIANNQQKQRLVPQIISLVFKIIASLFIFPLSQVEGLRLIYILSEAVLTIGYFVVVSGIFLKVRPVSAVPGQNLKIALITFNQEGRGTFLRALYLGKELSRLGHNVTILAGSIEGKSIQERNEEGVNIVTFPRLVKRLFLSGWGLDELLSRLWWAKRQNFDLVHAFETRPTTLIPARLLQNKGAAFFSDWADWLGRGGSVEERPAGLRKGLLRIFETWYENRKFSNSEGITAICSFLVEESQRRGYPSEKSLLLPNGMRNPHLKPIPISQARVEKGLPNESVIIGYIGSGFGRDMELMYAAFSLVKEKLNNVKLLHVGRSNYFTPCNDAVICTGDVSDQDASIYLSACDLFWFPLRKTIANRGRLPLKLSDYLTVGRPIVSTDVGDLATWIRTLEVGLVGDDDPESISNMVVELINPNNQREMMINNALRASENPDLGWETRAKELEQFYYSRLHLPGESDNFGNHHM